MTAPPSELPTVTCPRCGKSTDRNQVYEAPILLFLLLFFAWNTERVIGCPRCVRKRLFEIFLFNIPMANVFFPFVGLPIIWDIASSSRNERPGIPAEFQGLACLQAPPPAKPPPSGGAFRIVLVFIILLAVLAVVFFVLPRLTA